MVNVYYGYDAPYYGYDPYRPLRPITLEQAAEAKRIYAQVAAQAEREKAAANARANDLLLTVVGAAGMRRWKELGHVRIEGRRGTWIVAEGSPLYLMERKRWWHRASRRRVRRFCCAPVCTYLHPADKVAAMALAIMFDEEHVWDKAIPNPITASEVFAIRDGRYPYHGRYPYL